MIGRRVQPTQYGWAPELKPGDYVRLMPTANDDGTPLRTDFDWSKHYPLWLACAPNGHTANITGHTIVEHEGGTITVSPSILISTSHDGGKTWIELFHGFLERGVWRSV
jgi:hypothetical protein